MIDNLSLLIFFIYTLVILMILVYISPILSAFVMILSPVASVYLLPEPTVQFFSVEQFSFMGVQIHNIHILLLIWSALIGIVAYSELLSWYLLMDSSEKLEKTTPLKLKSTKDKIWDFLLNLGKIINREK